MRKSDRKLNLVGREVYFNLPKSKMENINYLTPRELYTIIEYKPGNICAWILNNRGARCYVALGFRCSHLRDKTTWVLKNKSKVGA